MPIKHAAKRAIRKNKKQKAINLFKKKGIRDLEKKIRKLVIENKTEEANKLIPSYYTILDKANKTNLIKKGKAARKKSRISQLIFKNSKKNKSKTS